MNEPFASESERELVAFLARSAKASAHPAPDAFTDRVMARVALEPRHAAASRTAAAAGAIAPASLSANLPGFIGADPLPWWLRALAQPASVLAFVLIGITVVFQRALADSPRVLFTAFADALRLVAVWAAPLFGPFVRASRVPGGDIALILAALPLAALLAFAAYSAARWLALPHRPARAVGRPGS
jgi:hypothetical protein